LCRRSSGRAVLAASSRLSESLPRGLRGVESVIGPAPVAVVAGGLGGGNAGGVIGLRLEVRGGRVGGAGNCMAVRDVAVVVGNACCSAVVGVCVGGITCVGVLVRRLGVIGVIGVRARVGVGVGVGLRIGIGIDRRRGPQRSEEHTSELVT